MSREEASNGLGRGLDIGLASLCDNESAAAVRLIPISANDDHRTTGYISDLHQLPGFAESSPTRRWVAAGEITSWTEPQAMAPSGATTDRCEADADLLKSVFASLTDAADRSFCSSNHDGCRCMLFDDQIRLLVLQPGALHPLQLYKMPEQVLEDGKLSLMPKEHYFAHYRLLEDHLSYNEALILPHSLEAHYIECSRCGKAVPTEKMNDTCVFHPGSFDPNLEVNHSLTYISGEAEASNPPCESQQNANPTPPNSLDSVQSLASDCRLELQYYKFDCCGKAGDRSGCTAVESHSARMNDLC